MYTKNMERSEALAILQKYVTNKILLKHSLATEATMQALASYFGEDEELWGVVGLLHDADYELAKGHPEKHGLLLFKKEKNIPENIAHAIKAHNYKHTQIFPENRMDWAITCCDELTALIVAATLLTPSKKINDVTVEYVLRQLREKKFARGADKSQIYLCQQKLGIPFIEFVTTTLHAMQKIGNELEL